MTIIRGNWHEITPDEPQALTRTLPMGRAAGVGP